jgi:hypothetical protein
LLRVRTGEDLARLSLCCVFEKGIAVEAADRPLVLRIASSLLCDYLRRGARTTSSRIIAFPRTVAFSVRIDCSAWW